MAEALRKFRGKLEVSLPSGMPWQNTRDSTVAGCRTNMVTASHIMQKFVFNRQVRFVNN
jgi:hypothetical protein